MKRLLSCSIRLIVLASLLLALAGLPLTARASAEPSSPDAGTPTYTVRPGDSLASIAKAVYGDETLWPAIYAANTLLIGPNPRLIRPGQVFRLPAVQTPDHAALCGGEQLGAEGIAAHVGLSVEEVTSLHSDLGLTFEQICEASPHELEEAFEELAEMEEKTDHPAEAAAFRRLQLQDENGYIPPDGYIRAAEHMKLMRNTPPPAAGLNATTSWTWLGPGNVGGRIRSIVVDPDDPDTMWIGSVGGGIWKTTNGGASWEPVNDFMANLAVSTMVMNPVSHSVMYAGTGEGFYNIDALRGAGVFKSTDRGETWEQLPSTASSDWYYVNRLDISPDGNVILAATRSGIWRSTDAGLTWTQVLAAEDVADVNFDPTDGTKAIAGARASGNAYYSVDGGVTWNSASFSSSTSGRVEIAYAPSNPSIVYASINQNNGELWKSADGGQSYTLVNSGNEFLGSQGWYGNIVWVNPYDPDFVVVGGIDLWRSTDGGATLNKISHWYEADSIHADHHAIVESPEFDNANNRTVFFGNDGGIYKTDDVATVTYTVGWQELNNNLGITQFYGGAGNFQSGRIVGGAQDNGSLVYWGDTETWRAMFGGDGGYCAADPDDPDYLYGEYTDLRIHRSTDGGVTSSYIYNGIDDAGTAANFIAPFILDPNDPNTMLAGGDQLWRSTNVKDDTPSWSSIKEGTGSYISAIAVAQGNSDIVWVGHNDGDVYFTTNGTAITPTWTRVDTTTPALPNRYVSRITIDPNDPNKVYVTFGGFSEDNIYRTTDSGQTWTDITGDSSAPTGLPAVPVHDLDINPGRSDWLYAATDVGIFTSEDGGATWYLPQDGPANVSVDELFWLGEDLIAVTHGRGMFKASPGDGSGRITVSKMTDASLARTGSVITYAIVINNPTPTSTLTMDVTDTMPADVTFITATNGGTVEDGRVVWHDLEVPSYTLKTVAEVAFRVETSPYTQVVNHVQAASDEFALAVGEPVTLPRCLSVFYDDHEGQESWTESYDDSYNELHWVFKDDGGGYQGSDHYWYVAEADGWAYWDALAYLTSPEITVPVIGASKPILRFWHKYDLFTYNGEGFNTGRLEIKVNDGDWTYVDDSHFLQNGYNYHVYNEPSENWGFSGQSGQYIESRVDLSDFIQSGDTFQIRFFYKNEFADSRDGWYVDNTFICLEPTDYLTITKQAPERVVAGQPITFDVVITNVSPITFTDLVVTDRIPDGAFYVSGGTRVGDVVSWTVPSLAPLATITESFVVTATADITNSDYRVAHASGIEAVGAEPVIVRVADVPDVTLVKTVEPSVPGPGQAVTFTLTFSNLGMEPATGVVITDLLPVALLQPTVLSSGVPITARTGITYVWDVGDLTEGEGGIITITGVLSDALPAGTLITNTATITATDDGNAENNTASAVMSVANLPPIAEAGGEQWVTVGDVVTLDGSGSYDPNGDALTYHWAQSGGSVPVTLSNPAAISPTFTASASGIFTFTLTVTDTAGLSASDTTRVIVAYRLYLPLITK